MRPVLVPERKGVTLGLRISFLLCVCEETPFPGAPRLGATASVGRQCGRKCPHCKQDQRLWEKTTSWVSSGEKAGSRDVGGPAPSAVSIKALKGLTQQADGFAPAARHRGSHRPPDGELPWTPVF